MALLEDMLKGNAVTGLAIGLGTVLLAPTVLPAVGRVLRPAAKAAIKGGLMLYRETAAEFGEAASDLIAEARAELEQSNSHAREKSVPAGRGARTEGH